MIANYAEILKRLYNTDYQNNSLVISDLLIYVATSWQHVIWSDMEIILWMKNDFLFVKYVKVNNVKH